MALRTEQKLPIILFVVFLTLSAVGFLFFQSTASFQEAIAWQKTANESVRQADQIANICANLDRGVFGFLLTGSDTYIEQLPRNRALLQQNISALKQTVADDEKARSQVQDLETAITELLNEVDRKISARKIGGKEEGLNQTTNIMDRPRMEAVQNAVSQLKTTVTQRFQAQDTNLDKGLGRSIWLLIMASATGLVALALANFVVFREIKKRQIAESGLIETNRNLEGKVEARTEELLSMNERLLEIGSERESLLIGEQRARQEAEVANRLRDEFMATVSHELRTPLNSILGWARLLKDGTLDHGQTQRAVTTIIKNSETQNRLIEDLMDVARLISGKLELESGPVELLGVVGDSVEIARPAIQQKRLRVEIESDWHNEVPIINGDSNRLRQVFSNLLTNAIKFSQEGGNIHIYSRREGDLGLVEVVDDGVGISENFVPLVFERFRQDVNSPGRNGGLGLGLAIVRNLVEMHGGTVSVESEGENRGAKFSVRLPLVHD
jgi:signal transduction histidine kinase